jgi:Uma2 family endonuclease
MARQTFAPWAELVPNKGLMTADELLRMPDDGWHYELVDGVLVKMPPPGFEHGLIVAELAGELRQYAKSHKLGRVVGAETGFLLSRQGEPDTVLAADISFVRAESVPPFGTPGNEKYLRLAPDLVAEVASPDQYKPEMAAKAKIYLDAGVRLVWVVWPGTKTVDVWRPGSDEPLATLAEHDSLDGLDVVPGFTYPLADLFA